jgi:hypothetical protein
VRLSTYLLKISAKSDPLEIQDVWDALAIAQSESKRILRWGLLEIGKAVATVEVGVLEGWQSNQTAALSTPLARTTSGGIHIALVVPTGVGASIGGFIGDAAPVARALETICDTVITHPNVVNAADFYGAQASWYVDGYTLDRFFDGQIRISRPRCLRLGLLVDRIEDGPLTKILNAANALRSVSGLDLVACAITREKVRAKVSHSEYGHFLAEVTNPEVLFEAADSLLAEGAQAIAAVTEIGGFTEEDLISHYFHSGPNPVGSMEALISRAITLRNGVPCAHAPVFSEGLGGISRLVDPRASAEPASGTGLPCVLYGLSHAPTAAQEIGISVSDLSAIIVPYDCAGGPPSFAAHRFGIPLIAVRDNRCKIGVPASKLSIATLVNVASYAEALAFVVCIKAGLSWDSIRRPFSSVRTLNYRSPSHDSWAMDADPTRTERKTSGEGHQ